MLRLAAALLCALGAYAQCTLTGVTITLGTPNVVSFTGMSGPGCPTSGGGGPNDVTAAVTIPAGALVVGDDGARGVKDSAASVDAGGNVSTPGGVQTGMGGSNTGFLGSRGITSGKLGGFAVLDSHPADTAWILPPGFSTGQFLQDGGPVPCPALPAGAPATCHQLVLSTPAGGSTTSSGGVPGVTAAFIAPPNASTLTAANAGTATATTAANGDLVLVVPGTASSTDTHHLWTVAKPAAPYTFTIALTANYYPTNYIWSGICLYDSVGGGVIPFGLLGDVGGPRVFATRYPALNGGGATDYFRLQSYDSPAQLSWWRLQDTGTQRIYSISRDGTTFLPIGSPTSNTDFLANPNRIGVCVNHALNLPTTSTIADVHIVSWSLTQP